MSKIGRGVIKRGNVFRYRVQRDGKRLQISLQTGDEKVAIERVVSIKTSGALELKENLTSEVAKFLSDIPRTSTKTCHIHAPRCERSGFLAKLS